MLTNSSKRNILYACTGAMIEWYDFAIFIFLAPYLAQVFFPEQDHLSSLMKTYCLFAAGYIFRPIGGIFLASLGDRIGRKKILIISLALMSLSLLITTVTPSYASVGILAVWIIVLTRALQGCSVGGQYNGVLVILAEMASPKYRGFTTAFGTFVAGIGIVASSMTIYILSSLISTEQMLSYGWRIPFAIGFLLSIIAIFLQRKLNESCSFKTNKENNTLSNKPVREALTKCYNAIIYVFALSGFVGAASYFIGGFMPGYLSTELNYSTPETMLISSISTFLYAISAPLWGLCSDFIGRKKLLFYSIISFVVLIFPLYMLIQNNHLGRVIIIVSILMLNISAMTAVFVTVINELFPASYRFSGISIGYNLGNTIFASTAPMIASWLIIISGYYLSPAIYVLLLSIPVLLLLKKMPETYQNDFD
ncbi:MAG: MHS family proline/betaine transporter-like MFS transporter [Francisellaceae bacterium]